MNVVLPNNEQMTKDWPFASNATATYPECSASTALAVALVFARSRFERRDLRLPSVGRRIKHETCPRRH